MKRILSLLFAFAAFSAQATEIPGFTVLPTTANAVAGAGQIVINTGGGASRILIHTIFTYYTSANCTGGAAAQDDLSAGGPIITAPVTLVARPIAVAQIAAARSLDTSTIRSVSYELEDIDDNNILNIDNDCFEFPSGCTGQCNTTTNNSTATLVPGV